MPENKKDILWRVYLVFIGFIFFGIAILWKVGNLQFSEGDYWKLKADSSTLKYQKIEPMRGNILATDGSLLATSLPRYDVRVDMVAAGKDKQMFLDQVDSLAYCLSQLFKDKSKSEYKALLKQARKDEERYFLLKRNISFQEQKLLRTFPLFRRGANKGGLIMTQLSRREKPFRLLAQRTIGYSMDNKAVTPVGIEGAFDKNLRGVKGIRLMQKIAGNVWKPVNNDNEIEPKDGSDVITTIDLNMQDVAESALMKQLEINKAIMGCAVLMEVSTGRIKAIANLKRVEEGSFKEEFNYAIGQGTEPGSTFKLASLMAGIEDGYIDLDDQVETYGGVMNLAGGIKMRDSHEGLYGKLSVKDVFAHSSNVGVSSLIMKYYSKNPQAFIDRIRGMHIVDTLHLQIPGEAFPSLKNTTNKDWSKISLPFVSIGYETKITPLQLLTFYNAVANNGKMVQPLFVQEIRSKGKVVKSFNTKVIADSICSQQTIKKAKLLLEEVVKTGTASQLKNSQYTVAGKTGTAQIVQDSGYDKKNYQASFVGYFPADKPKYSCIVVIYSPGTGGYYGGSVACPVFKEIADQVFALNVDMHEELQKVNDSIYTGLPMMKAGRTNPTAFAQKKINLPVNTPESVWQSSAGTAYSINEQLVPNVIGMGLRDALYLLESQGLQVKPIGRGAVIHQSINAGASLQKGQQIIIELG